jgi:hypothetical protein
MSKSYSGCLLLLTALVFSTANTPAFVASRDLPLPQHADADNPIAVLAAGTVQPLNFAGLPRQYSEEGGLMRFGVDEFHLPSLEIALPELFEWSDTERTYLALLDNTISVDIEHALDSTTAGVFRTVAYDESGKPIDMIAAVDPNASEDERSPFAAPELNLPKGSDGRNVGMNLCRS